MASGGFRLRRPPASSSKLNRRGVVAVGLYGSGVLALRDADRDAEREPGRLLMARGGETIAIWDRLPWKRRQRRTRLFMGHDSFRVICALMKSWSSFSICST